MFTVLLPPDVNPIAVNKYINNADFFYFIQLMYNLKMWIVTVLVFVHPQTVSYSVYGHAYGLLLYRDTVVQCLSPLYKLTNKLISNVNSRQAALHFKILQSRPTVLSAVSCYSYVSNQSLTLLLPPHKFAHLPSFYSYCRLKSRTNIVSLQT